MAEAMMADAVEHRTRPHHPAADCRYLRFATTRQGSPAEPIATGSGRYFTARFSRNQLKLFNVVWLDATMTACLPTWFNSQRRRATPTFTTTSAQSGRRCRSRGHALGTGASTRRASKSPMTGLTMCPSPRLSWTFSRSISVRFSTSCWARKTNIVNGGSA